MGSLVGDEVGEEVVLRGGALEVEVVGEVALHPAGVVGAQAAHGDERDHGHRHRQHHGEGEAEALHAGQARR